ncbi:zinc binding protein, putative [Ichthyophthirius multifiliis]|uniref:Zinc binding protein, putative n=1 Tax=Ichthyophthirius multifiliis TaxID=5932 RepID=G0QWA6_ICHMU|nr:zinc binding protein, putative [Ichthyophthirius multifiliis]EGR30501.1 zinc binding protein, putative [Ichthyophthirius multifiliis]|eukprot:XP_004032088.1 zinc binding protein, putative [Ichthyophthirius multifiliis]
MKSFLEKQRSNYFQKQKIINYHNQIQIVQQIVTQQLLECPICMDFFVNPVQTTCGHTFCEICLTESLLKKNICSICKADTISYSYSPNKLLSYLVFKFVNQYHDKKIIYKFYQQVNKFLKWNNERRVTDIQLNQTIDVIDKLNIWCKAEGWSSKYDEIISLGSYRLAQSGFFTKRKNIPSYNLQNSENQQGALQAVLSYGDDVDNEENSSQDEDSKYVVLSDKDDIYVSQGSLNEIQDKQKKKRRIKRDQDDEENGDLIFKKIFINNNEQIQYFQQIQKEFNKKVFGIEIEE